MELFICVFCVFRVNTLSLLFLPTSMKLVIQCVFVIRFRFKIAFILVIFLRSLLNHGGFFHILFFVPIISMINEPPGLRDRKRFSAAWRSSSGFSK